jgi:hypothetical protein
VRYGLELMVETGTGCGPGLSSERPMQAPESRPVQGTPLISGMSGLAAVDVNPCEDGEFGTRIGVHVVVKTSSSSPEAQAAIGFASLGCAGWASYAAAGVTAIVTANPPARINRRTPIGCVLIEPPFAVVYWPLGGILRMLRGLCWHSRRPLRTCPLIV